MRTCNVGTYLMFIVLLCSAGAPGCSNTSASPPPSPAAMARFSFMDADTDVHARDDFYGSVNAAWLRDTEIPLDQAAWGSVPQLKSETLGQLQRLIENLGSHPADKQKAKGAQVYASFLDEDRANNLGVTPIKSEWTRIEALQSSTQIPALIAHFNQLDVSAPYSLSVHQDAQDPTRYVIDLRQGGLGLPDRTFYLNKESKALRERYQRHIEFMMNLAGDTEAGKDAPNIVTLETALANAQWTSTANRDPVKTYNKFTIADLGRVIPDYDWPLYLKASGIAGKTKFLIISQPSYLTAFGTLLRETPLPVWRSYFKWRLLSSRAPYLSKPLLDEQFAFDGTGVRGIARNATRAARGVMLVNELIGEAISETYVKQYLPSKRKDAIDAMLQVVLAAYRTRLKTLEWMGPDAQKAAQKKLTTLVLKIGAPTQYRDYGKLHVDEHDLVGNVTAGRLFEYQRNLAKLGQPIARDEWSVLPQTVTVAYDPQLNEIVLPTAFLQAPFFDEKADPALNYGGIGVVIARQISRAFDTVGSQFEASGRLEDWLMGADRDQLDAKIRKLTSQESTAQPPDDDPLDAVGMEGGIFADNVGLAMAYLAFHLSLRGEEAPTIDGLNADQRFFARFSQLRRCKDHDLEALAQASTGSQSPEGGRVNAALSNQRAFYAAYGLAPGDRMYLAPAKQVELWQSR